MLTWFLNLKIRAKLLTATFCILAAFLALSGYGAYTMINLQANTDEINNNWLPSVDTADNIRADLGNFRLHQYKVLSQPNAAIRHQIIQNEFTPARKELEKDMATYASYVTGKDEDAYYQKVKSAWETYNKVTAPILEKVERGTKFEDIIADFDATDSAYYDKASDAINDLSDYNINGSAKNAKDGTASFNQALMMFGGALLLVMLSLLVGAFKFSNMLSLPLNRINEIAQAVAKGDLSHNVELINTEDEMGQLSKALKVMVENLRNLIFDIKNNAATVASSSEELAATSSEMQKNAQGLLEVSSSSQHVTEELDSNIRTVAAAVEQSTTNINQIVNASNQVGASVNVVGDSATKVSDNLQSIASSTEEMSASVSTVAVAIEEMSASLREVASNAAQAAKVAQAADKTAESTRNTVNELGSSANEIGNIVELIKAIAAQTNLLALNATIEAASAGEAGKGFAVVANEVKELAKQSATATEDIQLKIEHMQNSTNAVIREIGEISDIIKQINDFNGTIASAVEEQSATINEISQNVSGAAQASSDVSRNVQQAAEVANKVTEQVQNANDNMIQITKNLEEAGRGALEISNSAGNAASRSTIMTESVVKVSQSSRLTEQGASNIQLTADELSKLAAKLEATVGQFAI